MSTATEKLNSLIKGKTTDPTQTEPRAKSKHHGKYVKKGGNGGARPNSGPEPLPAALQRRRMKQAFVDFLSEEVDAMVKDYNKGNVEERKIKIARLKLILEALFKKVKNGSNGDVAAAKELFDRAFGKSINIIAGDEDEPPVQLNVLADRILKKAYGDRE
jgi:hypothetical protein